MPSNLFDLFVFAAFYIVIVYAAFSVWFQPEKAQKRLDRWRKKDALGYTEFLVNSGFWLWLSRVMLLVISIVATWVWVVILRGG